VRSGVLIRQSARRADQRLTVEHASRRVNFMHDVRRLSDNSRYPTWVDGAGALCSDCRAVRGRTSSAMAILEHQRGHPNGNRRHQGTDTVIGKAGRRDRSCLRSNAERIRRVSEEKRLSEEETFGDIAGFVLGEGVWVDRPRAYVFTLDLEKLLEIQVTVVRAAGQ
jgi:hypothetical protein